MRALLLSIVLCARMLMLATTGRSTTWDSNILQGLLGGAAITLPAGCYIGLLSATPTADNGTFTELVVGTSPGYARATISTTNAAAAWSATTTDATGVWKTNAVAASFPQATGGWLAASGWIITDLATAGTIVYWGTFASPTTVGSGTTASFPVGSIKLTEA